MIKKFIKNVWLLLFTITILTFLFSLYQSITFSNIGAPKLTIYSFGAMLIIGSSYLHLNFLVKLLSIIQVVIYVFSAMILIESTTDFERFGHLLLLPILSNFYSSWCASIWHSNSKIRKITIMSVTLFYLLTCATLCFSFTYDILNKLTLLSACISLLISIIAGFFLNKRIKNIESSKENKVSTIKKETEDLQAN
jgi:hypothetical protein